MGAYSHKAQKGRKNIGGGGNPRKKVTRNTNPERVAECSVALSGLRFCATIPIGGSTPAYVLAPLQGFAAALLLNLRNLNQS